MLRPVSTTSANAVRTCEETLFAPLLAFSAPTTERFCSPFCAERQHPDFCRGARTERERQRELESACLCVRRGAAKSNSPLFLAKVASLFAVRRWDSAGAATDVRESRQPRTARCERNARATLPKKEGEAADQSNAPAQPSISVSNPGRRRTPLFRGVTRRRSAAVGVSMQARPSPHTPSFSPLKNREAG